MPNDGSMTFGTYSRTVKGKMYNKCKTRTRRYILDCLNVFCCTESRLGVSWNCFPSGDVTVAALEQLMMVVTRLQRIYEPFGKLGFHQE